MVIERWPKWQPRSLLIFLNRGRQQLMLKLNCSGCLLRKMDGIILTNLRAYGHSSSYDNGMLVNPPPHIFIKDVSVGGCSAPLLYHIAGHTVESNLHLAEMDTFRCAVDEPTDPSCLEAVPDICGHATVIETLYDGPAWLCNTMRHLLVQDTESGITASIEKIGRFSVSVDGLCIWILSRYPGVSNNLLSEGVLGLPFIYTLAKHGTWTLHGSSAEYHGKLAVFLGESGYGKSTLARFLHGKPGWRRTGDDILPVTAANGVFQALPHFPQMKLPPAEQPGRARAKRLPIHAIYTLVPPEESANGIGGSGPITGASHRSLDSGMEFRREASPVRSSLAISTSVVKRLPPRFLFGSFGIPSKV